jgi:hypothetical protein
MLAEAVTFAGRKKEVGLAGELRVEVRREMVKALEGRRQRPQGASGNPSFQGVGWTVAASAKVLISGRARSAGRRAPRK